MKYDLIRKATGKRLNEFAKELKEISDKVGFKQSARGWCYQLEVEGLISKIIPPTKVGSFQRR